MNNLTLSLFHKNRNLQLEYMLYINTRTVWGWVFRTKKINLEHRTSAKIIWFLWKPMYCTVIDGTWGFWNITLPLPHGLWLANGCFSIECTTNLPQPKQIRRKTEPVYWREVDPKEKPLTLLKILTKLVLLKQLKIKLALQGAMV